MRPADRATKPTPKGASPAAWVLAVAVAFGARPAAAQQRSSAADRERATELLRVGASLLEKKQPEPALEKFNQAYQLVESPKILFNIGLALTDLDRRAAALRAFQRYLREAKDDRAARREEAARRATALRDRVALLHIRADVEGASILVDGVEQGKTPLEEPVVVDPGPHGVLVQAAEGGRSWTRAIQADAGATIDLLVSLRTPAEPPAAAASAENVTSPSPGPAAPQLSPAPPLPAVVAASAAPGDEPPPSAPIYKRPWFWVAVGVGLAAAVTGIVLATSRRATTEFQCPIASCIQGR